MHAPAVGHGLKGLIMPYMLALLLVEMRPQQSDSTVCSLHAWLPGGAC